MRRQSFNVERVNNQIKRLEKVSGKATQRRMIVSSSFA